MTDANLPEPFVPADVNLRGMPGFMLDVNRLLASELVALGKPDECWAAVMLWCRAWQQQPPASLPNDERVLAAFSGAGNRWAKVKPMAMRGFVLCSDNRWYHPVLVEEVTKAWRKREAYQADQERLRKWRADRKSSASETADETGEKRVSETVSRTVSERVDRDSTGTGTVQDSVLRTAPQSDATTDVPTMRQTLWRDGVPIIRALVGLSDQRARILLGKLLKDSHDDCAKVYRALCEARDLKPADPAGWITAACGGTTEAKTKAKRQDPGALKAAFLNGGPSSAQTFAGTTIDHDPDGWRTGLA